MNSESLWLRSRNPPARDWFIPYELGKHDFGEIEEGEVAIIGWEWCPISKFYGRAYANCDDESSEDESSEDEEDTHGSRLHFPLPMSVGERSTRLKSLLTDPRNVPVKGKAEAPIVYTDFLRGQKVEEEVNKS